MTDGHQPDPIADQHRRAQGYAMAWAQQADADYCEAVRLEEQARAETEGSTGYAGHHAVDRARRFAHFHGTRSVEAARLAEMWAAVAGALTPPRPELVPAPAWPPPPPGPEQTGR